MTTIEDFSSIFILVLITPSTASRGFPPFSSTIISLTAKDPPQFYRSKRYFQVAIQ